jgi:hypothetical protein
MPEGGAMLHHLPPVYIYAKKELGGIWTHDLSVKSPLHAKAMLW